MKNWHKPPKLLEQLLRFFSKPEERFSIVGDFEEIYTEIAEEKGVLFALRWYGSQIFKGIPILFLKTIYWSVTMLRNYLKIAFRNIQRHKGYSFINISGLALGMACCIFLLLWVQYQISFDKFHEKANHLYRIEVEIPQPQGKIRGPNTPYPLGPAIKENIPEIKNLARWQSPPRLLIRYGDKQFYESGARAVDPSFLQLFSFPLIAGDLVTALNEPHSIILSEEMVKKYFSNTDPMGKILSINNKYAFTVTGIMKNFPLNSTLQASLLIPFDFPKELGRNYDNWLSCNCHTWVELYAKSQTSAVGKKISDFYLNRIQDQQANFTPEEIKSSTGTNAWDFLLMRLTDINLFGTNIFTRGQSQNVRIFVMLAVGILFIACINYMNLTTARSANRAKEVGLRKVVGAEKKHIITQFFGESTLLTCISIVISFVLVVLLLPAYNDLTQQSFTVNSLFDSGFFLIILCIGLLTGFISGSYPALFLSAFRPVETLKNSLNTGVKGAFFRKSLVVIQFSLSVILLIGTMVAYRQLQFMLNKDIGYDEEQLIYIPLRSGTRDSYTVLKEALLKNPDVVNVSGINNRVTNIVSNWNDANWEGKDPNFTPEIVYNHVDFDFIETMKIEMVEGRAFSKSFPTDVSNAFLVNEEMTRLMGTSSAVGKAFSFLRRTGTIVGVMKNFHHRSVVSKIEPLVFIPETRPYHLIVRLQAGDMPSAIESIESIWKRFNPQYPFAYRFLDEDFAQMYQSNEQMSTIFRYAAILAMAIACIGLFGLASYMTQRRIKEIGIRKTLGASVSDIMIMLSKTFVKWVMIANVIAWPIAYLLMHKWLQDYAYQASIDWWIFAMASILSVLMAVFTVGYQSIKAALANPIDILKYE